MSDTPTNPHSTGAEEPEKSPSGAPIYRYEDGPAPFELASGDEQTIAAVAGHIERHLGPTSGVFHELVSDKVHLDVHIVPPRADYPFYVLVTSGMSDRPMHLPPGLNDEVDLAAGEEPVSDYAELCILLPSTWNLPGVGDTMGESTGDALEDEDVYWPIRWLKMLARLPHEYRSWLGWGHTIPNGEDAEPFAPHTRLGCMLLLPPISLPEAFSRLAVGPDKTVQFLALYPIYPEEMELKMSAGVEELLERFEEVGIGDVVDPDRPNVALA